MIARISESFQILKFCLDILISEKQLLFLPLLSGFIISVFFTFAISVTAFSMWRWEDNSLLYEITKYVFVLVLYLFTSFVATFFNAAFVAIVYDKLTGGEGRFLSGLRVARSHTKQILIWSLLTATLGVIARISRDRLGLIGGLISTTYNLSWGLATFFVVPIILTGNFSVKHSIQESATLFHKTWKENVTGQLASGIILMIFALPPMVYMAHLTTTENIILLVRLFPVAVLYFALLIAISYSVNRIYMVVLFVYAKTGEVNATQYKDLVHLAFRPTHTANPSA